MIVDLRKLEDYNWVNKQYNEFHSNLLKFGANKISYKKLRCLFFDWLQTEFEIKMVIAGFPKNYSKYLTESVLNNKENFSTKFSIPYIEPNRRL